MEAFTSWIEKHVAPVAGKLGANRYIQSIQNTFLTLSLIHIRRCRR